MNLRLHIAVLTLVLTSMLAGPARPAGSLSQESSPSPQDLPTEKLKASRISARWKGMRYLMPFLGLPEQSFKMGGYDRNQRTAEPEVLLTNVICDAIYGEKTEYRNGVWVSENLDFGMPNWIAWDVNAESSSKGVSIVETGSGRDLLARHMSPSKIKMDSAVWAGVLDECWKWAWEKPVGNLAIVCGPLVYGAERFAGRDAVPYEYFLVVCKKVRGGLGYKSIGFLIPNSPGLSGSCMKFSECVNLIEHKSGYNFFPGLPSHSAEAIEGMTTYELFCPYIEQEVYLDDPSEREDFRDSMSDYLEDFRDR